MLVYYYLPKSYGKIGNKQIQGIGLNMPPTHMTYKEYKAFKTLVVPAPFTPAYIETKTGKPNFPYRGYLTLEMVKELPYRKLQQIASYFELPALGNDMSVQCQVRKALKDL